MSMKEITKPHDVFEAVSEIGIDIAAGLRFFIEVFPLLKDEKNDWKRVSEIVTQLQNVISECWIVSIEEMNDITEQVEKLLAIGGDIQ